MNTSDKMILWQKTSGHKTRVIAKYLGVGSSHISKIMRHRKGLSKPRRDRMNAIIKIENEIREMTYELNQKIKTIVEAEYVRKDRD